MALKISFVLFDDDPEISVTEIRKDLSDRWPQLPLGSGSERSDDTWSFRVGSTDVILAKMDAPVPWAELEGPCSTSLLWPDAESQLRDHRTHLVVTVSGELSSVELSTLLTQVTASVLATASSALGAYWGSATLLLPKAFFVDCATEMLPHSLPIDLWVDLRVGSDGGNHSSGFTTGLAALGHMEFETQDAYESPAELRERLWSLADYVLSNGRLIRDGNTVGEDANERIQVVYSDSAFGQDGRVMRLVYQDGGRGKAWWRFWD